MKEPDFEGKQYWRGQYQRLNYFLIASAFLVAAFVQLVANEVVNHENVTILEHAIAALGGFIAELYFFMNLWLFMTRWRDEIAGKKSTGVQTLHTWFIPLCFLVFWVVVWFKITDLNWRWVFVIPVIPLFIFALFQRTRGKVKCLITRHKQKLLPILEVLFGGVEKEETFSEKPENRGELMNTPTNEPTLRNIEEHLKQQDREIEKSKYGSYASFGASIIFVGLSLWIGSRILSDGALFWDYIFLIVMGFLVMLWSGYNQRKIKD